MGMTYEEFIEEASDLLERVPTLKSVRIEGENITVNIEKPGGESAESINTNESGKSK